MGILQSRATNAYKLPPNKITPEIIQARFSATLLATIPKDLLGPIVHYSRLGCLYLIPPSSQLLVPTLQAGVLKPKSIIGSGAQAGKKFAFPTGVAVDHCQTGNIVIVDYNSNQCELFDPLGNYILRFGTSGTQPGQFSCPFGVTYNHHGEILVTDSSNGRVQVFDGQGQFLRTWGSKGSTQGCFTAPRGLAVDEEDNVYVTDQGNNTVQVFAPNATFLRFIGDTNFLDNPNDVGISPKGEIIVVECGAQPRVQIFDSHGTKIRTFGSSGQGPGLFNYPHGLVVDSNGHIVVSDYRGNTVQVFNDQGNFLHELTDKNRLERPLGLAIDRTGSLLVVDNNHERIQIYGPRH